MPKHTLWYVQEDGNVRGPFPARLIGDFLLLGRISTETQVSTDRAQWQRVGDLSDLVPPEMRIAPSDPEALERLQLARRRADERMRSSRRHSEGSMSAESERRAGADRRRAEPAEALGRRAAASMAQPDARRGAARIGRTVGLWLAALVALGVLVFHFQPRGSDIPIDCNAAAQRSVVWSNCKKVGARLEMADLRDAQLRNANFTGANLAGARLDHGDLSYSDLSGSTLRGASLVGAQLRGATLRKADLSEVAAQGADLSYAILEGARLEHAVLTGANLTRADLRGAELSGADLANVHLEKAVWIDGRVCGPGSVGRCL